MFNEFVSFIKEIFYKKFKLKIYLYLLLSIFGSMLEILSIGLLIPVLNWVTKSENELSFFNINFHQYFDLNINEVLLLFLVFLLFIFLLKLIFFILFEIYKNNFLLNLNQYLSSKIYTNYISRKYLFYVNSNSSEIINNIRSIDEYCNGVFTSVLKLIVDILTLILFIVLLLMIEITITLISIVSIILVSLVLYYVSKESLSKKGEERYLLSRDLYKFLSESLRGIREVKIYNLQKFYTNLFINTNLGHYKNATSISLISFIPKVLLEFFVIFLFLFSLYYLKINNYSLGNIALILGTLLLVMIRVMPIVLRILNNLQIIKSKYFAFKIIQDNINFKDIESDINLKTNKFLAIKSKIYSKDLVFGYEKNNLVFDKLNFEFKIGNIYGIYGDSGSGKSTFVDIVSGLLSPSTGNIMFDDNLDIDNYKKEWVHNISFVPQSTFFYDGSILDNIIIGNQKISVDYEKINEILKKIDLIKFVNSLPKGINTNIGESGNKLSGGQRQRLGIARALYKNSKILILDESTTGLDLDTESKVLKTIQNIKKDKLTIVISHRKEVLEFCDYKYKILNKKIIEIDN